MGNLKFGTNDPLALYMGTSGSTKAYFGTTEVYSGGGKDYSKEYLTFEILTGGVIGWAPYDATPMYCSLNDGVWDQIYQDIYVEPGDVVRLRGNTTNYGLDSASYCHFTSTASFNVEGNILSLIYGDSFTGETEFPSEDTFGFNFCGMFYGTGVVSAENLVLPQDVRNSCYRNMFENCTSLTAFPELPATSLYDTSYCYNNMFKGCTSLTTMPDLPATELGEYCYQNMFSGCTSLTGVSELPATALTNSCYLGMFRGCRSLTTMPDLPATELGEYCYQNMFSGCTSLTAVTTSLPATALTNSCYLGMFRNCTSLTSSPSLPATTLAASCYQNMFSGCTSITAAPELPATKTTGSANYNGMFRGCSSLSYIKCMLKSPNNYSNWVEGVSGSGTFVKNPSATWNTGPNGIPEGWTVQDA